MKLRDRVKELRRVPAGELIPNLLDVRPRSAGGYAADKSPGQAEMIGKGFVPHAVCVAGTNLANHIRRNYCLRVSLSAICARFFYGVLEVLGSRYIFQIACSVVGLVRVNVVHLVAIWARANMCLRNDAMHEPARSSLVKLHEDRQVSGWHRNQRKNLASPRPSPTNRTPDTPLVAGLVIWQ